MHMTLKSALMDLLTGFLSFLLLALGVIASDVMKFDLQAFFVVIALLFSLAGFLRGRSGPENIGLVGALVSSGGLVPIVAVSLSGEAFTNRTILLLVVSLSVLVTICGIVARRAWVAGSRRKGLTLLFLPVAVLALACGILLPLWMKKANAQRLNKPAPQFSISTLEGKAVNSSELSGHVVVLAFWATWCAPCRRELPDIEKLYRHYKANPEVLLWAVDFGGHNETLEKAKAFVKKAGLDLPCAYDNQGAGSSLGVHGLPAVLILDKSGHIREIHTNYDASEDLVANLSENIESLLREAR